MGQNLCGYYCRKHCNSGCLPKGKSSVRKSGRGKYRILLLHFRLFLPLWFYLMFGSRCFWQCSSGFLHHNLLFPAVGWLLLAFHQWRKCRSELWLFLYLLNIRKRYPRSCLLWQCGCDLFLLCWQSSFFPAVRKSPYKHILWFDDLCSDNRKWYSP